MAIFGDFFASCIFREPRAAHFRPAFYICTKATPSMVDIQCAATEIRRGIKEDRKKPQDENIVVCLITLLHRATITKAIQEHEKC